jgi:hypothetical protein
MRKELFVYLLLFCALVLGGLNQLTASVDTEVVGQSLALDATRLNDLHSPSLNVQDFNSVSFLFVSSENPIELDPIEVEEDDFFYFKKHLKDIRIVVLNHTNPFIVKSTPILNGLTYDQGYFNNQSLFLKHLALRI